MPDTPGQRGKLPGSRHDAGTKPLSCAKRTPGFRVTFFAIVQLPLQYVLK
ncbi:MAG: hypothetical protein U0Q11_13465 [Vicinamibacterales bacterium]